MVLKLLGKMHKWWDYHFQWCLYHRGHIARVAARHQHLGIQAGKRMAYREMRDFTRHKLDFMDASQRAGGLQ